MINTEKLFQESKQDAEIALDWNFSVDLRFKLYRQLAQCCSELHDSQSMKNYLSKAYECLEKSTTISAEEKGFLKFKIWILYLQFIKNNFFHFELKIVLEKFKVLQKELLQDCRNATSDNLHDETLQTIPQPAFGNNQFFDSASGGIEKQYDEVKGRFVVANRDIKRKQILFFEKPFAFVLLDHAKIDSICANCCKSQLFAPFP